MSSVGLSCGVGVAISVILFLMCASVASLFTHTVRDFAVAHNLVSRPESDRHVHIRPIPRLGGIAVFATIVSILPAVILLASQVGFTAVVPWKTLLTYFLPASIIFLLGLCDDLRPLNAYLKFGIEACAAAVLWAEGVRIVRAPLGLGSVNLSDTVSLVATVIWVVWVTNAFNLIDGLDGLAAGSALLSTAVICLSSFLSGQYATAFLTIALAGAIAGFLTCNFNPASIFLGDCGSLTIGFLLSAFSIEGSEKLPTGVAVAIPLVCFGLPILDVMLAVFRRVLNRRPVFSADREHIHHKLLKRGLSQKQAVLVLYAASAVFGIISLLLLVPGGRLTGIALVAVAVGVLAGVQQLRYHELAELGRVASRTLHQRQIVANNLAIRRSVDALKHCENLRSLCIILQQALEPIGFSGITIRSGTSWSASADIDLLKHTSTGDLAFFWDQRCSRRQPAWTLTLRFEYENASVAFLTVHRLTVDEPVLVDLNVFELCGFGSAFITALVRAESAAPRTLKAASFSAA